MPEPKPKVLLEEVHRSPAAPSGAVHISMFPEGNTNNGASLGFGGVGYMPVDLYADTDATPFAKQPSYSLSGSISGGGSGRGGDSFAAADTVFDTGRTDRASLVGEAFYETRGGYKKSYENETIVERPLSEQATTRAQREFVGTALSAKYTTEASAEADASGEAWWHSVAKSQELKRGDY